MCHPQNKCCQKLSDSDRVTVNPVAYIDLLKYCVIILTFSTILPFLYTCALIHMTQPSLHTWVTTPNVIAVDQTVRTSVRMEVHWTIGPLRPAFQGHWN